MKSNGYRVLMIGWEYPPYITGGLGVASRSLARALAQRGHHVYFLLPRLRGGEERIPGVELVDTLETIHALPARHRRRLLASETGHATEFTEATGYGFGEHDDDELGSGETALGEASETEQARLEAIRLPRLRGGYGPNVMFEVARFARYVTAAARRFKVDVVHAHDWMAFRAGLGAARRLGVPFVCHVHATEFDRSGLWRNQSICDIEGQVLRACDAVIPVSRYTGGIVRSEYQVLESKVFPVHNGVDLEGASPTHAAHSAPTVLFLGRVTHQKGPEYFVRAAKAVAAKLPSARFLMIGSGDLYKGMIEYAASLGVGKNFTHQAHLPHAEIGRLFSICDAVVMPSVSEPFGIVALEAMAHGVPVLLSKQSGAAEALGACLKFDFWDVRDLSSKLLYLLSDPALRRELSSAGAAEARRVSWSRTAQGVEDVYKRLLSR